MARVADGQLAGRVFSAQQDLRQRTAQLLPAVKRLYHRVRVLVNPWGAKRLAADKHHDQRLAKPAKRFEQLHLVTREGKIRTVAVFTVLADEVTYAGDNNVAFARDPDGLVNLTPIRAVQLIGESLAFLKVVAVALALL